ncbi:MAG: hypothetical protein IH856_16965 [Deltaproteobacteria bacterium]|nr:hypothetical protein [Deltaproteobacteria bacterium]
MEIQARRQNELLDEELSFIRENPHRERVAQCFSLAHIDFGRADYGFVDGEMQMYEINTNPNLPGLKERPDGRNERRRIIRQQIVDAFRTIDVPLPDAPPVRFSHPGPAYHRMRPWRPVRTSIARLLKLSPQGRWLMRRWLPVRASIAHLLKPYPQVRWLIRGRFW